MFWYCGEVSNEVLLVIDGTAGLASVVSVFGRGFDAGSKSFVILLIAVAGLHTL